MFKYFTCLYFSDVLRKGGKSVTVVVVPDDPKEKLLPGAGSVCVASRAACTAAATVKDIPLYQHIAALRFGEVRQLQKVQ